MSAAAVEVRVASEAERELVGGLGQFYVYDFSEMEPEGSDNLDFGADGGLHPGEYFDSYWREEGRWPLLIRVGGKPAGFALLNRISHLGARPDFNMGEFFVARKHRRRGVGAEAVRQVLALHPGRWEVAVLARNKGALSFWPRALAAAGALGLREHRDEVVGWDGSVWSFTTPPLS